MSTQITLSEAAKRLKVSEKSIRRYIKAGRMKARLIKGQKGYEYRIDANQLKVLEKPPRGKNSHKVKKIRKEKIKKLKKKKIIKKSPVETRPSTTAGRHGMSKKVVKKTKPVRPLESVGEILKKKKSRLISKSLERPEKNIYQKNESGLIDYKTLYENLLLKYEQTLIMLGSLEAQVSNRTGSPANSGKIDKLEDSIAKQEEIIMDLYQTIQLYKNEHNY